VLVETRFVATQNRVTVVRSWVLARGEVALGETSGLESSVPSGTAVLDKETNCLASVVACIQTQRLQKVLL
jgi:hypothetical protein